MKRSEEQGMNRRQWLTTVALGCAAVGLPHIARAEQGWPKKPIRLIVPSSSGGVADLTARAFAHFAENPLKQPLIVENRPGAGAIIGAMAVKNAAPDGYTFLISGNSTQAANPSLYSNLPYNPGKDFEEIGMFGVFPMIGLVRKGSSITSVGELITRAKATPGKLTYGYHAASAQVPAELLKSRAGIDVLGVPYRAIAQLQTDIAGGVVDFAFVDAVSAFPSIRGGLLQAFAVTSPGKFGVLPELQPVAEVLPGFECQGWLGLSAPRGTPPDIVLKMNQQMAAALSDPKVRQSLEGQGMTVRAQTPEEQQRFVDADRKRWADWVRIAKIQPQAI